MASCEYNVKYRRSGTISVERKVAMRATVGSLLVLLAFCAVLWPPIVRASAELPPEILVDKHLIHAEQLHAAKDNAAAFDVMRKIIALQKEYSLAVPHEFHFKYAQVALAADSMRIALESVTRYLAATGKEGQHYQEALKVMLKAEGNEVLSPEEFYNDVIKAEGTCEGLPRGSSCWMELTNHPDCYFWNDDLSLGESFIWSGMCTGHAAEGEGTLTPYYLQQENGRQTKQKGRETTGRLKNGKKEGKWVWPPSYTSVVEGSGYWSVAETYHVNGRQGILIRWAAITTKAVTNVTDLRSENPHDAYIYLYSDGDDTERFSLQNLDANWTVEITGPDETVSGRIVIRTPEGREWGGHYVNGRRHGHWIDREGRNWRSKGEYIHGKRDGEWHELFGESCKSVAYRQGEEVASQQVDMSKCEGW